MSSTATVKMGATREGPDAGILFYQDRHAARDLPGDENRIGGNSFSKLEGLLYFPTQTEAPMVNFLRIWTAKYGQPPQVA